MELSSYSNERLLLMISQSYNFGEEVLLEVCNEALKRELISFEKLNATLKKNELIRKEKKEKQEGFDIEFQEKEFKKHSFFYYWFKRMSKFILTTTISNRYHTINPTERYDISKKRRFRKFYSNED